LWQSGDFPAATEQLRLAIQNQPDYAEAYYTLGTVLKQMDKLPDAAHALHQAILLQPDFAGAHTTLAAVLRQLGDTAGAAAPKAKRGPKSVSERLTSRQPLSPPTHGRRLLGVGDLEGAISQFRAAIGAMPTFASAHYQLGLALTQKGEKEESAKEFQKAAELDPRLTPPAR